MQLTKITIEPKSDTLTPCLLIGVQLEADYKIEGLISICGILKVGDKILCELNDTIINHSNPDYNVILASSQEIQAIKNQGTDPVMYVANMPAFLLPKAIDYIEREREKNINKSIDFTMEFIVKTLRNEPTQSMDNKSLIFSNRIIIRNERKTFRINQSDWIQKYAKPLGIGDFILLELKLPENNHLQIPTFWTELYKKLSENVADMHKYMVLGDWRTTMLHARKFLENAKIGDNKEGHQPFKEKFNQLMSNNQHSQQGIQNFYDGTWKFFDFVSKYIHDQNPAGQIVPEPICKKEDAYFAYTLAVGLLSFIGNKISEN